jgi:hypothetical protein
MKCLQCNKETSNPKFCNPSCAAKFNNTRRSPMPKETRLRISETLRKRNGPRLFNCLYCGKLNDKVATNREKFCSQDCFFAHRWETVTKPRIEAGQCNYYARNVLKKYLVEKYENKCALCSQTNIWNGQLLIFHLDHIDGNSDNNFPNNLRQLCPNCHSQTETYCNKAKCKKETKRNQYLRKIKGY